MFEQREWIVRYKNDWLTCGIEGGWMYEELETRNAEGIVESPEKEVIQGRP
jgi:hypothetical protein